MCPVDDSEPAGFTETPEPTPEPIAPKPKKNLVGVSLPKHPAKRKEDGPINLNHHSAHCAICHHPEREAIDQAFLHWQRSSSIAHEFELGDRRVVYRHARAFGLYQQRASRSRRSLEFIMEQAETVEATADSSPIWRLALPGGRCGRAPLEKRGGRERKGAGGEATARYYRRARRAVPLRGKTRAAAPMCYFRAESISSTIRVRW